MEIILPISMTLNNIIRFIYSIYCPKNDFILPNPTNLALFLISYDHNLDFFAYSKLNPSPMQSYYKEYDSLNNTLLLSLYLTIFVPHSKSFEPTEAFFIYPTLHALNSFTTQLKSRIHHFNHSFASVLNSLALFLCQNCLAKPHQLLKTTYAKSLSTPKEMEMNREKH